MKDTIIFMSAYESTKWHKTKLKIPLKKKPGLDVLLEKYHLTYMLIGDKLVSTKGKLKLCTEYDYIQQSTKFSFVSLDSRHDISDFEEIIDRTGLCVKMLHAQSVLSDPTYFQIDCFICMESFLVYIGGHAFQIDPVIFSMNRTLIIAFEVIDYETGFPLKKDDVYLLSYIYSTKTFQHHKEATKLKISYMTAQNESKKKKNGLLLNILLYFLALIGAVDTLDMLEQRLGMPFNYSFAVVTILFSVLGVIWWAVERKRSK